MSIFRKFLSLFTCFASPSSLRVLIIVDVQKTFCKGGGLAVPDGDAVVALINEIKAKGGYDLVILTQDAHPEDHSCFAFMHGKQPFEQMMQNGMLQTLWPKHGCLPVKGYPSNRSDEEKAAHPDESAEFHDDLNITGGVVLRKGQDPRVDSLSGFFDNGRRASKEVRAQYKFIGKSTGLGEYIRKIAGKRPVDADVVGLALDYCVKFTALDAREFGFHVRVIADATRSTALNTPESSYKELREAGCEVVNSREVFDEFERQAVVLAVGSGIARF